MKYDAFISYRHTPIDMEIAKLIHSELEKYKVPIAVQKSSGKKRINRVFRDQEELPIGNNLTNNITTAIKESEFLIVVCSTRTKESEWVAREIDTFISEHGRNNVLAVLVDGSSEESFPPALLVDVNGNPAEPLAADIRGVDGKERRKKLKTELLRLAAPILYCNYDDLRQRHRERKIKSMAAVTSGIASVLAIAGILFALYNARMAAEIQKNYEAALMNQSRYLADTSLSLTEMGDREAATIVALEALGKIGEVKKRPYVAQAEYALSNALSTYSTGYEISKDRLLSHGHPVINLKYNDDGSYILSSDEIGCVYLWQVSDGKLIAKIDESSSDSSFFTIPYEYAVYNDEIIVIRGDSVAGYNFDGELVWSTIVEDISDAKIYSKNGLAMCILSQDIKIFDINSHEVIKTITVPDNNLYFSSELDYNNDTNELVIGCSNTQEKDGLVCVYDIRTGMLKHQVQISGNILSSIKFLHDNDIILAAFDYDDLVKTGDGIYTLIIQAIDIKSEEHKWDYEHTCRNDLVNSSPSILKVRTVESSNGESINQAVFASGDEVYTFDQDNGDILSYIRTNSEISQMLVSAKQDFGYLGEKNGSIEIVNLTTGEKINSQLIDTGLPMSDMIIANGVVAIRAYKSADILLMKYINGSNMETLLNCEDYIRTITTSAKGDIFAVSYGTYGNVKISFYDNNGNIINTFNVADKSNEYLNVVYSSFISDGRFLVLTDSESVLIFDPSNGEVDDISDDITSSNMLISGYVSNNGKYAVIFGSQNVSVFDVEKHEEIFAKEDLNNYYNFALVSEDGSKLYIFSNIDVPEVVDLKSQKETTFPDELCGCMHVGGGQLACVNNDGSRLAMFCKDGTIKVLDTQSTKVIVSVPGMGLSNTYIRFSDDGNKLIYQGDDMFINILDVESGKGVYVSERQHSSIIHKSETSVGKIGIVTDEGMLLLDTDSYTPIAFAPGGAGYLEIDNSILSYAGSDVYKFPFQTIDGLIEEARKVFPDIELSDNLLLKYHME